MARWKWSLILMVLLPVSALLGLLLWRRLCQQEEAVTRLKIRPAPPPVGKPPARVDRPASHVADDLKRIKGIGPKISGVLQEAGVTTFAQLAAADVDRLVQILKDASVRVASPGTWPEQASLAAAGKWDALEALQAGLKGGRRV
jgi:predicted flap endonuclease-1-like 5' DNA nuclease